MSEIAQFNPFKPLSRLDTLADTDDFLRSFGLRPSWSALDAVPDIRLDINEDDQAYRVKAEIAAVENNDMDLLIDGNKIAINAEIKHETGKKEGHRELCSERYYGKVYRAFSTPSDVDSTKAGAKYDNGVRTLMLPEKSNGHSRKIAINQVPMGAVRCNAPLSPVSRRKLPVAECVRARCKIQRVTGFIALRILLHHRAIATIALCLVQARVRHRHQLVRIGSCRPRGDSCADRYLQIRRQGVPRELLERAANSFAKRKSRPHFRTGHCDRELLAAVATDPVRGAAVLPQDPRRLPQHGVAECMPESVVDRLEAVDIQHGRCQRRPGARCLFNFFAQIHFVGSPVRQSRQ